MTKNERIKQLEKRVEELTALVNALAARPAVMEYIPYPSFPSPLEPTCPFWWPPSITWCITTIDCNGADTTGVVSVGRGDADAQV